MTTGNRNYQKRVFDLTYEKREPAGPFVWTDYILDETGAQILDEASDPLLYERWFGGVDSANEGMHFPKRTFDLTYSARDYE